MRVAKASALFASVLAMFGACGINELDYEGKSCPCPSGYRCDHETNRCTRHAAEKGGTGGDESGGVSGSGVGGKGSTSSGGSETGGSGGGSGRSETGGNAGSGNGGTSAGGTGGAAGGTGGTRGGTGGPASGGTAGTGNPWECVDGTACETLPNHGLDIIAVDIDGSSYTDCSKNCLGLYDLIVGHTIDDAQISVDVSTGRICMAGYARGNGMVELDIAMGDFDISDPGRPERAISGFEFTATGPDVPAIVHFGYYMAEDALTPRCLVLDPASGHHSVAFDAVHVLCGSEMDVGTLEFVHVMNASVYIPSYGGEVTFDFCLDDLRAVR
jgi:hypothetical protein